MRDLRAEFVKTLSLCPFGEGLQPTVISGVHYIKISEPSGLRKTKWRASLSLIAQGIKEITLGTEVYRFSELHFIATPVELPVISRIDAATREKPFLGLMVEIDPMILAEVATQLEISARTEDTQSQRALFTGATSDAMLEAAIRLAKILQKPDEARVIGPLLVKEILFYLLKSSAGPALHQFVRSGSKMHRVAESIFTLRSELMKDVDVDGLARRAMMSRSAFFKHFKDVTSLSPIQFQKRLRLLEARRLMIEERETAEGSAFKVGYKSAAQFSREYARMFGDAPFRDAVKQRASEEVPGISLSI